MSLMVTKASVLKYLAGRVEGHEFGSARGWTSHNLSYLTVDDEVTLVGRDDQIVTIPAGSTLIVYRHPLKTQNSRLKVACFHHPDKDTQTVVYAGGRVSIKKQSLKSVYDHGPRPRQSASLPPN